AYRRHSRGDHAALDVYRLVATRTAVSGVGRAECHEPARLVVTLYRFPRIIDERLYVAEVSVRRRRQTKGRHARARASIGILVADERDVARAVDEGEEVRLLVGLFVIYQPA